MKLVGVENNIVDTDNSKSDFLIVSDQPIKNYSYYFELEARQTFEFGGAAIAFIEKDQNNKFVKENITRQYGDFNTTDEYDHDSTDLHKITRQYYQNSLNLELESDDHRTFCELMIINDKNDKYDFNYSSAPINYYTYYDKNSYDNEITFYRLGLAIDIDPDKKKILLLNIILI